MSTYFAIARASALVILEAPSRFWSEFAYSGVDLGMTLFFWSAIAASSGGSMDPRTMVTYFLLAAGINNATLYRQLMLSGHVRNRVKSGSLSAVLLRPVADLPALYAEFVGGRVSTVIIGVIFTCIGVALTQPHGLGAILFLPAVVAAWAIGMSFSVFVAAIGIRIIESQSLRWVFSFGTRLATGAVVPLTFYPQAIQDILKWTPFPALVSTPIRALGATAFTPAIAMELIVGCTWAAVLWIVALIIWRSNLRHYDAIGL